LSVSTSCAFHALTHDLVRGKTHGVVKFLFVEVKVKFNGVFP